MPCRRLDRRSTRLEASRSAQKVPWTFGLEDLSPQTQNMIINSASYRSSLEYYQYRLYQCFNNSYQMFYVMPPRGVFDHHDHWSLGHGYPSGCRAQALSCGMPHAYYRSRASMPSWPSPSIRSIRNTDGVILVIDLPGFSRAKDSIS